MLKLIMRIMNFQCYQEFDKNNYIYIYIYIYTVGTESIQTPLNFSLCYIAAIC